MIDQEHGTSPDECGRHDVKVGEVVEEGQVEDLSHHPSSHHGARHVLKDEKPKVHAEGGQSEDFDQLACQLGVFFNQLGQVVQAGSQRQCDKADLDGK